MFINVVMFEHETWDKEYVQFSSAQRRTSVLNTPFVQYEMNAHGNYHVQDKFLNVDLTLF